MIKRNFTRYIKCLLKPSKVYDEKFASSYLKPPSGELLNFTTDIKKTGNGNKELYKLLTPSNPLMATRFGNVELHVIMNYLKINEGKNKWHSQVKEAIFNHNALFPKTEKTLEDFSKLYLDEIKKIDVLGVWHNRGEEELNQKYFPKALLVDLVSYESFFYKDPWTKILKNKKVLVIHPYAASITTQYLNRDKLFSNPGILPEFDLKTFKPFNSLTDSVSPNRSWFDELEIMKQNIIKEDFDIALIAAGTFGLPLAGFIRRQGPRNSSSI